LKNIYSIIAADKKLINWGKRMIVREWYKLNNEDMNACIRTS
jgi:hypothetical protein